MKIKEILALSLTEPIDVIAKNRLTIGKTATRNALKNAGCFSKNGVRGWFYEGDPVRLEQSIYEFVETKRTQTTNKEKNPEKQHTENKTRKEAKKEVVKEIVLKKATYEVEEQLHDELKIRAIREKRNVSDIVNEIFREALK